MTNKPPGWRILLQILGFCLALAVLAWCVSLALSPENRTHLDRLAAATPAQIASLLTLSAATVLLNGLIFWITIRPEKPLHPTGVLATNALATALAYLPFKIGLAARVLVHVRRDRLPLLTIGAWFAAVAALMLCVLAPLALASLLRPRIDLPWIAIVLTLTLATSAATLALARAFTGDTGLQRLHTLASKTRLAILPRALQSEAFSKLHAALRILAHPTAVAGSAVLRLADLPVQAARFAVAAAVLGTALDLPDAVLLSATYFIAGILSPVGMLGSREAATVAVAAALGLASPATSSESPIILLILFITATESLVTLTLGVIAAAYLRVDRLLTTTPPNPLPSPDEHRPRPEQPDRR